MTLRRGVRKVCKILSGSLAREILISVWFHSFVAPILVVLVLVWLVLNSFC